MGKKGGDGSFLGLFRRKPKDDPLEPDQDKQDKPEAPEADIEGEPESEGRIDDFEGTPRPWEHSGDEESTIQTYIEQDSTAREPTAVVDIPLGSSEEGETTLRVALQQASSEAADSSDDTEEGEVDGQLDPNSTVHIELPESLMKVGDESDIELMDTADKDPDAEDDVRITVTDEEPSSAMEPEPAEPEEPEKSEEIEEDTPEEESIEVPVYSSDYKSSCLSDVPLTGMEPKDDKLGILPHAEALAQFIENSETPVSLCIQGESGSGKTSLLRFIRQALVEKNLGETRSTGRVRKAGTAWLDACPVMPSDTPDRLFLALVTSIIETVKKGFSEIIDKDSNKSRALERAMRVLGDAERLQRALGGRSSTYPNALESGPDSSTDSEQESESNLMRGGLPETKHRLIEIMEQYREATGNDRLVVFIDDVDLVPSSHALAFLNSVHGLLAIEGLAFVFACNTNQLIDKLQSNRESRDESGPDYSFFERLFQVTYTLPSGTYDLESYLQDLFRRAGINYDPQDPAMFPDLLKRSVGPNPLRIKLLVNSLALLRALHRQRVPAEEEDAEQTVPSRLTSTLFGAACLEAAFSPAYQMMQAEFTSSNVNEDNYSGLLSLLEQPRGSDDGLAAVLQSTVQAHPAISKLRRDPGDALDFEKMARFIDLFRSMLVFDESGRLELSQVRDLETAIQAISLVSSNPSQPFYRDRLRDMATDFSRLVEDAVSRIATNPPQAHNKWAHHLSSIDGYGYRIWYRPHAAKAAWGSNRLFYYLDFDRLEGQAVKLGLQIAIGNVIREGVTKETLDEVKNVPIFQEGGYTVVQDSSSDWMRFEMLFEDTHWSSSSDSRVKQAYAVAGEINRLIEATSHIFDVKPTAGIGKGAARASITRVNAPCPNCGKKDLAVLSRLGDGSLRLQCMNCKSKVQAKTSPTAAQPGKALQDS